MKTEQIISLLNMFSLKTKEISKAPLSMSFLSARHSTVHIASSRLSDSGSEGKIGLSEEKKRENGERWGVNTRKAHDMRHSCQSALSQKRFTCTISRNPSYVVFSRTKVSFYMF